MNKKILMFAIILSLIIFIAGCNKDKGETRIIKTQETTEIEANKQTEKKAVSNTNKLNPRDYERFNGDGAVQMSIIFANPLGQGKKGYLTFVAALDNHSYNLDDFDLSKYVTLVDDKGNSPKGKAKWEAYSGGGHHVINYLLFPDGGFITPETKYIKLIIKDFIDVPVREFVWEKEFLGIKE
jgi:hypothetical protein